MPAATTVRAEAISRRARSDHVDNSSDRRRPPDVGSLTSWSNFIPREERSSKRNFYFSEINSTPRDIAHRRRGRAGAPRSAEGQGAGSPVGRRPPLEREELVRGPSLLHHGERGGA